MNSTSGAAQSYLESFRPFDGVGGFENVKSDLAAQTLATIPAANAAMQAQMANTALGELGDIKTQRLANEASLASVNAQLAYYDRRDQLDRRRMAGTAIATLLGGVGTSLLPQTARKDPRTELVNMGNFESWEAAQRANRTSSSRNATGTGIRLVS